MCGFCAVFAGIPHWSETASDAGDRDHEADSHEWRLGRMRRLRLINAVLAHFGCRVEDWMGGPFMLSSQRGRTELVDQLPQVWRMAETIAQRAIDPLDAELLTTLKTLAARIEGAATDANDRP